MAYNLTIRTYLSHMMYLYVVLIPIMYMPIMPDNYSGTSIRIISWNMKGLTGACPYLNELMKGADICVLTEHHLYKCELKKVTKFEYRI